MPTDFAIVPSKPLPISVCMIAGAEAARIGRSLAAVAGWVTDMHVVLNDDVADGTDEIAREHGASVHREPWQGHVAQKNSALAKATQPWVLGLDGDEVASPELRDEIARLFGGATRLNARIQTDHGFFANCGLSWRACSNPVNQPGNEGDLTPRPEAETNPDSSPSAAALPHHKQAPPMLQSPSQIAARSGSNAPPTRRTCRVCGRADEHAEHIVREMQFGTREKFAYFQCRGCHCLQIVSIPADLARYYPADYYSTQPLDERKYQGFRGAMRLLPYRANVFPDRPLRWMISRLHRSNHFVPLRELGIHRATRVLDVGCGNGKAFAYPLKAIGFASVTGCDPFIAQELRYENGLVIHRATLNEMESKGRWELITFHHAFEHLPDPVETIATVARLLQPSGHCLIRIPTCSSYSWDNYGVHWVQLDAPRHLFLHSTESMRRLAERAGLELVSIRSDSTYFQFWGSENYRQDIPLIQQRKGSGISRLGWAWKKQRWQRRAAALNRDTRGDQAAFILRKPAT